MLYDNMGNMNILLTLALVLFYVNINIVFSALANIILTNTACNFSYSSQK